MAPDNRKNLSLFVSLSSAVLACLYSEPARALSLACVQPLVFASITLCGVANTATVTPSGTRSFTGCLTGTGPFSNGSCNVSQTFPFQSIKVTAPTSGVIANGGANMSLTNFDVGTSSRTFTTSGPFANIPVGATLHVGAAQTGGNYSGTFTMTAVFQ